MNTPIAEEEQQLNQNDPVRNAPGWAAILAAGGIEQWVVAGLRQRGLLDDDVDPAGLSKAALKQFKARRDEQRRVTKALRRQAWQAYRQAHVVHLGNDVFYHDTDDIDRFDLPDPDTRRDENALPVLKNAAALAAALNLTVPRLRWLCYQREVDSGSHYVHWTVPKRSGGERLISAPKHGLKQAQRWLLRHIVEHLPVHGAAHGFVAGRSTLSNASQHAGAEVVVKFDIQDFYPSITWRRVKGVFRKAGYGEQTATLLALLCTAAPREALALNGQTQYVALGPRALPQGAPTSPGLSNTLCLRLDCRLAGLANRLGFRYTRYADDLSFSWHRSESPPLGILLRTVRRIVTAEGFTPHPNKTRILRRGRRQAITGLIVNPVTNAARQATPVRVPRTLVRQLRAALHNRLNGKPGSFEGKETLAQLRGWVAYLHMIDPQKAAPFQAQLRRLQAQSNDGESV